MKFTTETPELKVWDAERKQVLCRFENGVFETEDERTIKLLSTLKSVKADTSLKVAVETEGEDIEELLGVSLEDLPLVDLKDLAKEKGIKFAGNIGKDTLIERIKAQESEEEVE